MWNTIICGYSQQGYGEKALEAFQSMLDEGCQPNNVTFIGVPLPVVILVSLKKGKIFLTR